MSKQYNVGNTDDLKSLVHSDSVIAKEITTDEQETAEPFVINLDGQDIFNSAEVIYQGYCALRRSELSQLFLSKKILKLQYILSQYETTSGAIADAGVAAVTQSYKQKLALAQNELKKDFQNYFQCRQHLCNIYEERIAFWIHYKLVSLKARQYIWILKLVNDSDTNGFLDGTRFFIEARRRQVQSVVWSPQRACVIITATDIDNISVATANAAATAATSASGDSKDAGVTVDNSNNNALQYTTSVSSVYDKKASRDILPSPTGDPVERSMFLIYFDSPIVFIT